jgi:putative transposase
MSQPRKILPGATYLITRRVLLRHFLLRPDAAITQILVYLLAVSSRLCGVEVHAFCAMSTHLHLVATDVKGELPRFLAYFHRMVSLCTKVLRNWEGAVWEPGATSVVQLLTHAAVVEKIAYVLANPVAAGLVEHAGEWPGAKVDVAEIGRGELRATRPTVYLDAANPEWPEQATLPVTLPPDIEKEGAESFRREVKAELDRLEAEALAEVRRQGRRFLGKKRACEVSPCERATSFEAARARNPTFAVGHGQDEARQAAGAAVRDFRAAYRVALGLWRAGTRSIVFPTGTWWMDVFHHAGITDVGLVV